MKRAYFSIADSNNLKYFEKMKNSLRKFDPDTELILFGDEEIKAAGDPMFFYRATPVIAKMLFEKGFTEVCKLDADQIITGNLDHIWEGEYDIAVVNNSNPRDFKVFPYTLLDIHPLAYVNAGFVVMKSKEFIDHWFKLCMSGHFETYQMREQDLLNIIVFYGNYNVKFLDNSDKWHGLVSKGYWSQIERDSENKLWLRKNEEWPVDEDKQIVALHWAGGNDPKKMEDINIRFKGEVTSWLRNLIK